MIYRFRWGIGFLIFLALVSVGLKIYNWNFPGKSSDNTTQVVKIRLTDSGLYEISARSLQKLGIINLDNLHLYKWGTEVPLWLDTTEDGAVVRFYAEESRSKYFQEGIYWLTSDEQKIWPVEYQSESQTRDPSLTEDPVKISWTEPIQAGSYIETLILEENMIYQPQVGGDGDHWLWQLLAGGQEVEYELEINGYDTGTAMIVVEIWSNTDSTNDPDHHLRIAINSEHIFEEFWDGKGGHSIYITAKFDNLKNGKNRITISAPGDLGLAADLYYINRISLFYPRKPIPEEDQLDISLAVEEIDLSRFTEPISIYDITDKYQSKRVEFEISAKSYQISDQQQRYVIVGTKGYKRPDLVDPYNMTENLFDISDGAEYLVVGPNDLLGPIDPLIEYRRSQGLQVRTVSVEDIYNQFNYGYPDPMAITSFVKYAYDTWDTQPRYLLLIGDASYDPLQYISSIRENRLPTFFVNTLFGGETSSDIDFVQLNEDQWPDLAIGRIPAQGPDQVEIIVGKILEYEKSDSKSKDRRIIAVADGQDVAFRNDAQDFLDRFPSGYDLELFFPESGSSETNKSVISYFNKNMSILAYFGHGSVNMWGKDKLFTVEDADELSSGKQVPIVINMTCLTGLFTHPKAESLTEALLWNEEGGAVAVLAPSSLTLPTDQSYLSSALADALIDNQFKTIGEVHLYARRNVPLEDEGAIDVMRTFMLFGDPALSLPFTSE